MKFSLNNMAIVRYDKKVLRRLRYHTLFIISPPISAEQYQVGLDRAHEKIKAFYSYVSKWLGDDAYGGRVVPYNIPRADKYKYLVYVDPFSKTRWGVVYEDLGNIRIVRMLEMEKLFASRYGLIRTPKRKITESQLRHIIRESLINILYN